jgi:hypothetical protein
MATPSENSCLFYSFSNQKLIFSSSGCFEGSFINFLGFRVEICSEMKFQMTSNQWRSPWKYSTPSKVLLEGNAILSYHQEKINAKSYITVCRLSPGNPRKISPGKNFFLLPVFESTTEKQIIEEKETKNPEHVDT